MPARIARTLALVCLLPAVLLSDFYDDMVKFDEKPKVKRVEGKAVIVVIRKMLPGAGVGHNVYLDERFIGKTLGFT